MTRSLTTAALLLSLAGSPVMFGCDRTVSETKTEKTNSDGTTSSSSSKTTQAPDGSTKTTVEKEVNH